MPFCWAWRRPSLLGAWRRTYVITAVVALYLNVFVLIVQLFLKMLALKAIAPTQTEPPFKLAQLVVLVLFARTNHCLPSVQRGRRLTPWRLFFKMAPR